MITLTHLPDTLLQTIHSYLNEYDQRVLLVLNSGFVRLGEGISINISSISFLKNLHSQQWRNIKNGCDRINLNFRLVPSERLYEMVMEIWPFSSLRRLSIDLKNALSLLEKNKLIKLQKFSITCVATHCQKDAFKAPQLELFDLLQRHQLQLKELEIFADQEDEDDEGEEGSFETPLFPSFSFIPGLRSLCVEGFIINQNPGDGFRHLKRLKLDCILKCDLSHFDGVHCLELKNCEGDIKPEALKITCIIHIYHDLSPEDCFYEASHLELTINQEFNTPIHLIDYENARASPLFSQPAIVMPEKLSDKLKYLHIDGLHKFLHPLPQNSLKVVELTRFNPSEELLQSLSGIEKVEFSLCQSLSLESLGSAIKDISVYACTVKDYSPLGRFEKVSIISCDIPHPLKLSEVKELTIRNCVLKFNKELNGSLAPFLTDCPKLEVLDVDFSYFNRYDMIASEFPNLKKMVLRGVDGENVDMDLFCFSGFRKCLMPRLSRLVSVGEAYLLRY